MPARVPCRSRSRRPPRARRRARARRCRCRCRCWCRPPHQRAETPADSSSLACLLSSASGEARRGLFMVCVARAVSQQSVPPQPAPAGDRRLALMTSAALPFSPGGTGLHGPCSSRTVWRLRLRPGALRRAAGARARAPARAAAARRAAASWRAWPTAWTAAPGRRCARGRRLCALGRAACTRGACLRRARSRRRSSWWSTWARPSVRS